MQASDFRNKLLNYFEEFRRTLATDTGDWVIKGFIDIYRNVYTISVDTKVASEDLPNIVSVVKDFDFLLQEKWRIAIDRPGSGNTKNIGSLSNIQDLIGGNGPFVPYGPEVFDDYWMNYLTNDMARVIDSEVLYHNLDEYWEWRSRIPLKR